MTGGKAYRVWFYKNKPPTVAFRDFRSAEEMESWIEEHQNDWEVLYVELIPATGVRETADREKMKAAVLFAVAGKMQFRLTVETTTKIHHFIYDNTRDIVRHRYKVIGSAEWHEEALLISDFNRILEDILTVGQIWYSDDRYEVVHEIVGTMTCKIVEV